MPVRLARFLARAGVTSRRGAADLVATGRVLVNGNAPIGPGDPVDPTRDRVTLDGRALALPGTVWLALHKPAGYVTSRRQTDRFPSVYALVPDGPPGLVAVGRLDVLSEGLLLFTTDGEAANRLMHPRWQVDRSYVVSVTGRPELEPDTVLSRGVALEDGPPVRPAAWRFVPRRGGKGGEIEVTLREGRSRVVRRMAVRLGLGVRRLVRVSYGPVRLGGLPRGAVRTLERREVAGLYCSLGLPAPGEHAAELRPCSAAARRRASRRGPRPRS